MHVTGPHGVILLNLNWGYQVVRKGHVLIPINDDVSGPHRSPACVDKAYFHFERIGRLYTKLYAYEIEPSERMESCLARIISQDHAIIPHQHTAFALERRGVIERGTAHHFAYYYTDWKPIYPEAE